MRQTLFHIPAEIAGIPVFGFGWLLALWAVTSALVLGWLIRRQGFSAETKNQALFLGFLGVAIAFVLPALAGTSEGLPIRGFGVMLLLAVVAASALAVYRARQVGLDPDVLYSLGFWLFVSGIVGARVFYVVQKWEEFRGATLGQTLLAALNVTQGGLVVYGSVIGGGLALVIFTRRHKLPGLALADLIAPSLALALALGRVGCFLNGCCYGGICEQPWGVTFPWGSPPHVRQAQLGQVDLHGLWLRGAAESPPVVDEVVAGSPAARQGLRAGERLVAINGLPVRSTRDARQILLASGREGDLVAIETAGGEGPKSWTVSASPGRSRPVHPTQLYSAIDGLVICLLLWAYYPFRRRDGEVAALAITVYPVTRFLMEVIRTDELPIFLGMTISQNISVLLLAIAAGLWLYLLRQPQGTAFAGQPAAQLQTAALQ